MNKVFGIVVMWCVLIVVFVDAKNLDTARTKRVIDSQNNCENVIQFFSVKNITVSSEFGKGSLCNGQCCDDKMEALLRKQGQRDFAELLRHNSRSLQGLLTSTATTLQSHVLELARQSENKTLLIFSQVYRGMSSLARRPIERLYKDIRYYIHINSTETKPQITTDDIAGCVKAFFTELFPLAYHHSADISITKDFTSSYKECLKRSMYNISPFGEIPQQIGESLSKSLEATRLLLQAFKIGSEVLNTTDALLIDEHSTGNSQCHDALVKMTYCPKCLGLWKHTKPCSGYCLNVLRGCITKYVAELDLPWNGYVEGIETLLNAMKRNNNEAGINVDVVIKDLDNKISSAIMNYMEKGKDIDEKVKHICGSAEFSTEGPLFIEMRTVSPTVPNGTSKPRSSNPRNYFASLPEELLEFLNAIAKTKGFYSNLANTLCKDESFAEPKDQQCWNGERIAEYTKTVVDVGLDMQKYNPEVKPTINMQIDPKVASLVDKLRRVHHMAITSLGSNYLDADYMQRDGTDGSGSGSGPDFEDDRDDDYVRGSGSGNGPAQDDIVETNEGRNVVSPVGGVKPTEQDQPKQRASASNCITSNLAGLLSLTWILFTVPNLRYY